MSLHSLFTPRSIAVIGASTKPGSVGNSLTENLISHGYAGKVYPVNPKTDSLFGLRCYSSIKEIRDEIDLAIIIIPASAVLPVLHDVGLHGIKAVLIISAGFKETGPAGQALEQAIARKAKEFNIALLGPNCLGFLHPRSGLNASFAKGMPAPGSITFFSQSGALCTALLDLTADSLGFASFISVGNKTILGENELLRFFAHDKETKVIGFYTEGLADAKQCIEVCRTIVALPEPKPIIALKSGTTSAGTVASSSHTGALAGNDRAYQALFRQARIVRARHLEELSDFLTVFSQNPLPQGKSIGIITNAGGLGVLATDSAVKHGLTIAPLSPKTSTLLQDLPPAAGHKNPVDVLGDALADRYRLALDALSHDPRVDMLLVIVTPQTMTQAVETAEAIVDTKLHCGKPIVAVFSGASALASGTAILRQHGIATLTYPEAGAKALGALAQVASWRAKQKAASFAFDDINQAGARAIFDRVRHEYRTTLYETEVWAILQAYGFHFLNSQVAKNKEEAVSLARSFSGPVALKIISPDIIHKSDAGGVLLSIKPTDVGEKYEELMHRVSTRMPQAKREGVLIVEMAPSGGREIILGIKHEPGLGKMLMVGLGGIFVEVFQDVALRFIPLSQEDAEEMITELKSLPLLRGTRGQDGIDLDALKQALGRLAQLASDFPEIAELDINPLLCFPNGSAFRVLDARITLRNVKQ